MDDFFEALSGEDGSRVGNSTSLRDEANSVKACTTDVLFRALTFSAAILGLSLAAVYSYPVVALAAIPVSYMLGAASRVILHKYTTANRIFGYELHLARSAVVDRQIRAQEGDPSTSEWRPWMRGITWEEAVKAWRVFQATCFEHVYEDVALEEPRFPSWRFVKEHMTWCTRSFAERSLDIGNGYAWWSTKKLAIDGGGTYHSGGYLHHIMRFAYRMQAVCVLVLVLGGWSIWHNVSGAWMVASLVVMGLVVYWRCCRITRLCTELTRRREILEGGMLSIEACAVMWQAVVLGHYRAVAATAKDNLRGYTRELARQACDLRGRIGEIHDWVRPRGASSHTARPSATSP